MDPRPVPARCTQTIWPCCLANVKLAIPSINSKAFMTNATFADAIIGTNIPAPVVDTAKPNSIAIAVKTTPRVHNLATDKTHHFFDLFQFISAIPSVEVAAQVAVSTAWRIDVTIISAARQIYKAVRDDIVNQGIDERAEIVNALNMQAYAEESFHEIGSAITGPVATIKQLHYQREAWQELARRMTELTSNWQGVPNRYTERTLEDQIFNPGNMKVSGQTKHKLKMGSARKAEALGAPELAAALYEKQLARSANKAEDITQLMKSQAQGIAFMLDAALRHGDVLNKESVTPQGELSPLFSGLPIDIQRVLIDNAIKAAQRAEEWAADDRFITESAYDTICVCSLKAVAELQSILKAPKFREPQQQAEAVENTLG